MVMGENSHEERRLPEQLADQLPRDVRDALGHPFRRQILRVLDSGIPKLSAAHLSQSSPAPCSISSANYHLCVLTKSGLVEVIGLESDGGSMTRYFSSRPGQNRLVQRILGATEQADQRLLADAAKAHA
jgi:DNA-binding transcriptional ArsR family regulator